MKRKFKGRLPRKSPIESAKILQFGAFGEVKTSILYTARKRRSLKGQGGPLEMLTSGMGIDMDMDSPGDWLNDIVKNVRKGGFRLF